jgi:hypothetical protein
MADPQARPSAIFSVLVHVRAKKPPSRGSGTSPSLEIKCPASAFTASEIDKSTGDCTPFRLPVPNPIREDAGWTGSTL